MAESSSPALPGDVEWLPGAAGARVLRVRPATAEPPQLILRLAGGGEVPLPAGPGPSTEYTIPAELDWTAAWLQWPDGTRAALPLPHGAEAEVIELHPRRFARDEPEGPAERAPTERSTWTTPPQLAETIGQAESEWEARRGGLQHELAEAAAALARARDGERAARDAVLAALAAARADLRASRAAREADASALSAVTGALEAERAAHAVTRGSIGTLADALSAARAELAASRTRGEATAAELDAARAALTAARATDAAELAEARSAVTAAQGELAALREALDGQRSAAGRGDLVRLAREQAEAAAAAARRSPSESAALLADLDAAAAALRAAAPPVPEGAVPEAAGADDDGALGGGLGRAPADRRGTPSDLALHGRLGEPGAASAGDAEAGSGLPSAGVSVGAFTPPSAGVSAGASTPPSAGDAAGASAASSGGDSAAAPEPLSAGDSATTPAAVPPSDLATPSSGDPAAAPAPEPADDLAAVPVAPSVALDDLVAAPPSTALVGRGAKARLRHALLALAREDAATAGGLLVGLLPAQGAVLPGTLSYDLTVRGVGTFAVFVADGEARVVRQERRRPRSEALFHLSAEPVVLAELLAGECDRVRRLRRGVKLSGRRKRAKELLALADARLSLAEAVRAGARLEPALVYRALPVAIDPAWTQGHSFTVAQQIVELAPRAWHVTARDGEPLRVVEANSGAQADATVTMSQAAFDRMLRDEPPVLGDRPQVRGDRAAVAALKRWTDLARGV